MNISGLEITIKSDPENSVVRLKIFPFDFLLLEELLGNSQARINMIHAVVFNDSEGSADDIYITDTNFLPRREGVPLVGQVVNFFSSQEREYTINKLDMDCEDINVFYDDDALLILSIPWDKAKIDIGFLKQMINSLHS